MYSLELIVRLLDSNPRLQTGNGFSRSVWPIGCLLKIGAPLGGSADFKETAYDL